MPLRYRNRRPSGHSRMVGIAAVACTLFSLLAAASTAAAPPAQKLDHARVVDDPRTTPPPPSAGRSVALPHDWNDIGAEFSGQRWYLLEFDDPDLKFPALYIERACTNLEIWVNGTLLESGGHLHEPITRNCYYPQLFVLPRLLLRAHGNRLAIRVAGYPLAQVTARQRLGGLSPVVLGNESTLRARYERQLFWNVTVAQIIGAILALCGLLMLMLGWMRPGDRHFYHIGFAMLGWAVLGARIYLRDLPVSGLTSEIIITAIFPPVVYASVQFLVNYVRQPRRWITVVMAVQCLIVPPALVLAAPRQLFATASIVYSILALEFIAALVAYGWYSWRYMRTDFWLVGSAELIAAILTAVEISIQNHWLPFPKIHLLHFAGPIILMVIGARLVQQFVSAVNRSEQLNVELEQRVEEKSSELEQNFAALSELRAVEAALQERQRIATDLHDDLGAKLLSLVYRAGNDETAGVARSALQDLRDVVSRLSHGPLALGALAAQWRDEAQQRLEHAGIMLQWEQQGELDTTLVSPVQGYHLERILREALSNVIKHSGATRLLVALTLDPLQKLRLQIADNGRGYVHRPHGAQGHGINNMSTRAQALGAQILWNRAADGGCELEVLLPLSPPAPVQQPVTE